MYTIKRAAEVTGIGVATLRAWERRYGVVAPSRSEGRYRLYSDDDVRALTIMAALVGDGWTAREAAVETLRRVDGTGTGAGSAAGAGGRPAPVFASLDELDELLDAAGELDVERVGAVLDRALARDEFPTVASQWLMPVLNAVGGAWADGRVTAAGEHLISYAVQRRLAGLYDAAAARPSTGPLIVLGLPPGSRHELGLLAFAVAARQSGLHTAYLGADLPIADWEGSVSRHHAGGAVMSVPRLADVVPAQAVVDRLAERVPGVLVAVGGGYQDDITGAQRLGHDLGDGIALLRDRLALAVT